MKQRYRIAIIGGSIAGCSAAIALSRDGHDVRVFERSAAALQDRGAGIVIPSPLFNQLKELQWLDPDTPHTPLSGMNYRVRDDAHIDRGRMLWQRPVDAVAMRWNHLFAQLRKRLSDEIYCSGIEVIDGAPHQQAGYQLTLSNNESYWADLVVAADGISSRFRDKINDTTPINYSGYVLWRGLLEPTPDGEPTQQDKVLWHPYQGGMAGCYAIPSADAAHTENSSTLNWGIYDRLEQAQLNELLGSSDDATLGSAYHLDKRSKMYLQNVLATKIPRHSAELLRRTQSPFVQAIVDLNAEQLVQDSLALIGDAAAVLRPHTASGAVKAIENALSLQQALANTSPITRSLRTWQDQELPKLHQQVALSKTLGDGLITSAPQWQRMTTENMDQWWTAMLTGKDWYMK